MYEHFNSKWKRKKDMWIQNGLVGVLIWVISGLKMGVENGIFWSEKGSGFGETGGTPH